MKTIKYLLLFAAVSLLSVSCDKEDALDTSKPINGLGGEILPDTEASEWLFENFTVPYNIEVIYRWESSEIQSSFLRPLVPVREDVVVPFMEAIRDVWFEPYIQSVGEVFLKKMTPKKIVIAGSGEWSSGTIKLGQAEGGKKILLLNANNFDPSRADGRNGVKEYLHTIEHEFAHILHQSVMFDKNYQNISAGKYDPSNWQNITDAKANSLGFITPYSMAGKDEDFVEMISMIMVYGREYLENIIAEQTKLGNTEAVDALRQKETIVQKYLLDVWGIKFYDDEAGKGIVTLVQEAVQKVVNAHQ